MEGHVHNGFRDLNELSIPEKILSFRLGENAIPGLEGSLEKVKVSFFHNFCTKTPRSPHNT
jgi:hypothetical protein